MNEQTTITIIRDHS